MASTLRSLIQRIYPSGSNSERAVIAGLGYSGKTTLLYYLKLGEIVTTIPSIGFNVETVDVSTTGKKLSLELWDIGTGCASTMHMVRMLRYYMPNAKALIWVVDSNFREGLSESLEALDVLLKENDADPESADKHLPVLVLANKVDMPNSMKLDELRVAFSKQLSGRLFSIYSTSVTSSPPTGLQEAFDWLALALDIAKTTKKGSGPAPVVQSGTSTSRPNLREPSLLAKKLEEWLHRTESDSSPEDFIVQFTTYTLPTWDHYTHIRLAFLILAADGRQKGKDSLFTGLASYIAHNTQNQTNVRAFHFTMTYFWIQIVHFAIQNLPESIRPAIGAGTYPTSEDFFRFLLVNPHVVDGGLWTEYYSKETIMSPGAKAEMVLPDKKPLPSMVGRDAIAAFGAKAVAEK
ncbi:ADP-ribosylation factor [Ephemerocybe angulata]|uniref:ADP-ribosylation factor n=1 Tax=Ephemerocybe angulata TaxID=980116 RepID=A0A8H6IJ73_9AGAR|nr:ADP-ribosylation factor [Tulosesus angulatus]